MTEINSQALQNVGKGTIEKTTAANSHGRYRQHVARIRSRYGG